MTAGKSGSSPAVTVTAQRSRGMQLIRSVAMYSAIAVAVSAGGVLVGAMVLAPAVSRATPFFSGNAQNTETSGSVGQADGDGAAASTAAAKLATTEQFKPIAESIAAAKQLEAAQAVKPAGRTWTRSVSRQAGFLYEDTLEFFGKVPKITWVIVDVSLVALFAGLWLYRRRKNGESIRTASSAMRTSAAALPTKLVAGQKNRTPKAVAALAEAGTTPADIARRTGLPHDAVAMLLSLGTMNARQLQPPTA